MIDIPTLREQAAAEPGPRDLSGESLVDADLRGVDLSGSDLTGCDLSRADLSGANLSNARLVGAILFETKLEGTEFLGADLSRANLQESKAEQAGFGHATLRGSDFFHAELASASFGHADLQGADFRRADLTGARIVDANLTDADLQGATLTHGVLDGSCTRGASFHDADLRGARLKGVREYESANWVGADLRDVDFTGAWLARRFIMDQNYLDEFRNRSKLANAIYYAWWISSDCGRSMLRWVTLCAIVAIAFGWAYTLVGIDYGSHHTALSPWYFSLVTLTTLGYGDVLPATTTAQVLVMAEVLFGYMSLGGLLSIFATKMGRRAE